MPLESKQDLLDTVHRLVSSWQVRGAQRALAPLREAWPPMPIMTSQDWGQLLAALQQSRKAVGEITREEREAIDEIALVLEAWVYRC
ncbi:MAG TPA: hypothetical protein VF135_09305 [Terriglobales bacterium]